MDAFSHNFRSIIVADACGDCSPQAHKANLFDLDMKFGDVETLTDTIADLKKRYAWCLTQVLLSPAWQAKRALKPLKHSATQKHNSD